MKSSKKKKSIKEENEDDFHTWMSIHRPHDTFMKFCGLKLNEINGHTKVIIVIHLKAIWSKYQFLNQLFIIYNIWF